MLPFIKNNILGQAWWCISSNPRYLGGGGKRIKSLRAQAKTSEFIKK
jgi:hypothetical protein